jgi:GT2 family glycosyltransferase
MNEEILINDDTLNYIKNYEYNHVNEINFTSIVILTLNNFFVTKICIESIRKFTPKGRYEIIIVDNNSKDKTIEWLKDQSDLKVIYNHYNAGFPKGCNQGIEIAKGENILLLNNDTIVTPNWLNILDTALHSSENIGAVGPITNNTTNNQIVNVDYKSISSMIDFACQTNRYNEDLHEERIFLIGFCFLIKKSVLEAVGLFDEQFTPGNFEDNDLSIRILLKKYSLLVCKDVFIHHFGNKTFNENNLDYQKIYINSLNKFNVKWGFNINHSRFAKNDLIKMFQEDFDDNINVLEVGCSAGITLMAIKNRYKNSNIYGVEICEQAAKVSKLLANVVIGNVEDIDLPFEDNFFNYIILGDILECFVNPWKILNKLKRYLKKDGFILASIKNIMHVSSIKHIITGNFTYAENGILDKNDLRFFTLQEIYKMFVNNNFVIKELYPCSIPLSKDEEKLISILCKMTSKQFKQQYLAFKYLIKATKN